MWARLKRAEPRGPHLLVLPDMEAGEYLLCMGPEAQVAVPRGLEPPAAQCSRGTLLPLQELRLPLPDIPRQYLGQNGRVNAAQRGVPLRRGLPRGAFFAARALAGFAAGAGEGGAGGTSG